MAAHEPVTPQEALKEAMRSLEASEARYRSLVESLPDIVSSRTRDGTVLFVSPNCAEICGFSPAEVIADCQKVWVGQVHPDDQPALLAARQRLFESGQSFDLEYRFRKKDGTWAWFRTRSRPVERNGETHIDSIISDVTATRSLHAQMAQTQKMEALGLLTGGVAHDFNNILTAILVSAHFLESELGVEDPRREDATEIRKAAERAAGLTRQLLAFSRKQVLQPRRIELNAIITNLEKMLQRLIGEDIRLAVTLDPALEPVIADPGQIEQVIMNLVVNARDAMPRGGTLTLETGRVPEGNWSQIAIRDTGCGMDEATVRRIFEPFFTTKGISRGTGLGLSTCYGIVAQSDGFIAVESKPGEGSVFRVHLPVAPAESSEAISEQTRASGPSAGTERVLVVEDDERARTLVSRILAGLGYRLLVARDPADAHNLLERSGAPIDLVLTDVVMPRGSGPECVEDIKRICPSAAALYMSGYTDHPALHHRDLRSPLHFIQKPFAPEALARKVREVLDANRPAGHRR
jgi:two-component system, cell cycle sensor histidine kinase and response regulator CckA